MSCQKTVLLISDGDEVQSRIFRARDQVSTPGGDDVDATSVFVDRGLESCTDVRILTARGKEPDPPLRQHRIERERHRSCHRRRGVEQPRPARRQKLGGNSGAAASDSGYGILGSAFEGLGQEA